MAVNYQAKNQKLTVNIFS